MKILPVIDTERTGGPGKGLISLVRHIRKNADVPGVVIFHRKGRPESDFSRALKKAGIEPLTISESYPFDLQAMYALKNLITRHRPDIIQTHGYKATFYLMLIKIFRGDGKWIAWIHGWTAENMKVRIFHEIEKMAIHRAEKVICVSGDLTARIRTEAAVIPNGIEEEYNRLPVPDLDAMRKRLQTGSRKIILVAGRYSFEKGQDRIPAIAAKLREFRTDFLFLLVGEGPERDTILKMSASLGVSDYIMLHPYEADIRPFYLLADIVMMPSRSEGMPNVVLEALYMKAPMVSFDVGGVKEIYTDRQEGFIVKQGDINAMAGTLDFALNNRELAAGFAEAGYRKMVKEYLNNSRAEKVLKLYREIAG